MLTDVRFSCPAAPLFLLILSLTLILLEFFWFVANLRHTPQCHFLFSSQEPEISLLVICPSAVQCGVAAGMRTWETRVTLTLKSMADNWLARWVPAPIIPCCRALIHLVSLRKGRASLGENTKAWWRGTVFCSWSSLRRNYKYIQQASKLISDSYLHTTLLLKAFYY